MGGKVRTAGALRNNLYLYRMAWSIDPWRLVHEWGIAMSGYFSWTFFSIIFLRYLLGSIAGHRPVGHVMGFIALAMALFAVLEFYGRWFEDHFQPLSDARMYRAFAQRMFEKAARADLASYEDPEYYTTFTLALKEASRRLESVARNIPGIGAALASSLAVAGTLATMNAWVLLFVALPVIGNFLFRKLLNTNAYEQDREAEPHRRRIGYVNRVFFLAEYAKEIRLSRIGSVLNATMERGSRGVIDANRRWGPRGAAIRITGDMLTFLVAFQGVFLYGAWLALVRKSLPVGDFAVFASGIVSGSWMIVSLSDGIMDLMKNGLYIGNLRRFLEREPTIRDSTGTRDAGREFRTLALQDVWFRYDGQPPDQAALRGMSFTLSRGEKVALVGLNGAGKTTFTKILMRLYDPAQGRVLLDGHDIRELRVSSYRGLFATAFQDYRIFAMSVAENVLMRKPTGEADWKRAEEALAASGVLDRVMTLPEGMRTMLTREFDDRGAVLSAGELQKIAIARAFAADFQVAILDEPSSALDPIAEYTLYRSIMERCRDRTVIFISHRLSSATLADRIAVVDQGRIVEEGTHQALMARKGPYADMFRRQAERYVEDNFQTLGADA